MDDVHKLKFPLNVFYENLNLGVVDDVLSETLSRTVGSGVYSELLLHALCSVSSTFCCLGRTHAIIMLSKASLFSSSTFQKSNDAVSQ